jgi:arabinose-5-phosphate isomerase
MLTQPDSFYIAAAQRVIGIEAQAVKALAVSIDQAFAQACQLLLDCQGRTVVTGMGKSGHVGRKIAATLASTGTPAFFVHAAEASHGDLGMITQQDVVLALSHSGNTAELVTILPLIKRLGAKLISMTANPQSSLAEQAEVNLSIDVEQEACPLGLAPTSSTTACLVLGDALAVALLEARGFTAKDFALSHPGGNLGRRLLLRVAEVMHQGEDIPRVSSGVLLKDALVEMTAKRLGMTTVVDVDGKLLGVFTDGDLRRTLAQGLDIHSTVIDQVMTRDSLTINQQMLAAEALRVMEEHLVTGLVVTHLQGHVTGVVKSHDLLRIGLT